MRSTLFVILSLFAVSTFISCTEQGNSSKPPEGVISIEEAKILDRTFTKTRANVINEAIGMPDSRSSWWSIEDLEQYISYAKSLANEKGYLVNGLRVYYGAYPKDHHDQSVAGYSTLFIVPTGVKAVSNEASMINFNAFLQTDEDDLDIPPLNMGHTRKPPPEDYQ